MIDDILTFSVAGTDAVSNFLTAMVFYVFQHPRVAERLREEVCSVIKCNEDMTPDNFRKLKYL